ncbi:PKD domain-containing protein [Halorientalis salina]|uniref:PKD domain-containing protein n=1 Tax=Halorientalis salina TaxID=2932266 RepID=UPI0010AC80E2|nr:PKD domain-containing protein [Halorientalis salina]
MTGTRGRWQAGILVALLCCSVFALAVPAGATDTGGASTDLAQSNDTDSEESFAIRQGGECYEVRPLGDGTQTIEDYYNYSTAADFSSAGTTALQDNQVSNLFVYHGSEGYSLVFLHDEYADDAAHGSTLTMEFSGLPADGEWAVRDDYYTIDNQTQDDDYTIEETYTKIDWKWTDDRTDGGAFRGLTASEEVSITIDPAFNEAADHWGDWYSAGGDDRVESWRLYTDRETTQELEMDSNVTVTRSSCDSTAPSAELEASSGSVPVDESVTFDAGASTDDSAISEYRWDFDGDGSVERTTSDATITHTYGTADTYDASVTVADEAGNTDTATVSVTVTDESDGSDGDDGSDGSDGSDGDDGSDGSDGSDGDDGSDGSDGSDGDDGSDGSDGSDGDDGSDGSDGSDGDDGSDGSDGSDGDDGSDGSDGSDGDDGSDGSDGSDGDNGSDGSDGSDGDDGSDGSDGDDGEDTEPPTADIVIPETVTVDETVTITAENVTDQSEITHVCWYVDGEPGPDGRTLEETFSTTGTHTVTVELRDSAGNSDKLTEEFEVTAEESDGDGGNDGNDGSDGSDGDESDGSDGDDGDSGDGDESDDSADDEIDIDPSGSMADYSGDYGPYFEESTSNPAVEYIELNASSIPRGEAVEVSVWLSDTEDIDDEYGFDLTVHREGHNGSNATVVNESELTISPGQRSVTSSSLVFEKSGAYRAVIGNHSRSFTVENETDDDESTTDNDESTTDDGSDGDESTEQDVDSDPEEEGLSQETPGNQTTVDQRTVTAGTANVTTETETATTETDTARTESDTETPETETERSETTTSSDGPGFGILGGFVAVVLSVAAVTRRY